MYSPDILPQSYSLWSSSSSSTKTKNKKHHHHHQVKAGFKVCYGYREIHIHHLPIFY
jgi:hypothetical protein